MHLSILIKQKRDMIVYVTTKHLKRFFDYTFETVFLAPKSSYVWLNIIFFSVFTLFTARTFGQPGTEFLPLTYIALFTWLNIPIAIVLLWRRVSRPTFVTIGKKVIIGIFILLFAFVPLAALINYGFDVNYETQRRDKFVQANIDYERGTNKRIDTSVPEEWIKSDQEIRHDALISSASVAGLSLVAPFVVLIPMAVIRRLSK